MISYKDKEALIDYEQKYSYANEAAKSDAELALKLNDLKSQQEMRTNKTYDDEMGSLEKYM